MNRSTAILKKTVRVVACGMWMGVMMNLPSQAAEVKVQGAASPMLAPDAQVRATEAAFAQSMAERNHARFAQYIADEAIFFTPKEPLRGKQQVVDGWKRFFQSKEAPFSWRPDKVEVLASGNLALSTGPVFDPSGNLIAHFTSIWRQEAPGVWRIIFDKGEEVAAPTPPPTPPTSATPPLPPIPPAPPVAPAPAKGSTAK
jgi:ketosteroid isomerase-like protein